MKVPRYKDGAAIREAKKRCRRLYNKFKNLDFVIDDEKYFRSSGFQMAGNWSYYTCDKERTPIHVKTYSKKKFEPKVMLCIAISPKGISTPVITSGRGMAVTADSYVSNCLSRQLIPYLNTHYPQGGYIFWPDKVSVHYARITTDYLGANGNNYISKEDNPTEVPQCRPVVDFFGLLSTRVFEGNWVANNVEALKRRIRRCLREIPQEVVQATMMSVKRKLMRAYRFGLIDVCH